MQVDDEDVQPSLPATAGEQSHQQAHPDMQAAGGAQLRDAPHSAGLTHAESAGADQARAADMPLGTRCAVLCHSLLCCAVLRCAVLRCAVPCSAALCCAVLSHFSTATNTAVVADFR